MAKKKQKSRLTFKQKRWCELYLTSAMGNATEAARGAGYSKKSAQMIGSTNLTKPIIKKYLQKRAAQLEKEFLADTFDVMNKLKILSDFNIKDCYDEKGNLKGINELPREVTYAISGTETILKKDGEEWDTVTKIKVETKSKILAELARIKKLYEDIIPQNIVINITRKKNEDSDS